MTKKRREDSIDHIAIGHREERNWPGLSARSKMMKGFSIACQQMSNVSPNTKPSFTTKSKKKTDNL